MTIALVGVPGTLGNGRAFAPLFRALAARGLALPTTVVDNAGPTTVGDMAKAALAQVGERGFEQCIVVGYSLGATIAVQMGLQAPGKVVGLVLLDMNGEADKPENAAPRRAVLERAAQMSAGAFFAEELWPSHVAQAQLGDTALREEVAAMAQECGMTAFRSQVEMSISRPRTLDRLPELTMPVLVLCGAEDRITPVSLAQDIARALPHSDLSIISDAGHLAVLERPDAIADLLVPWAASVLAPLRAGAAGS